MYAAYDGVVVWQDETRTSPVWRLVEHMPVHVLAEAGSFYRVRIASGAEGVVEKLGLRW
jgi:hypothetical protein